MSTEIEKAVIAGLSADILPFEERSTEESLDELEALLETAGGEAAARVLQTRQDPDHVRPLKNMVFRMR